jgi:hypothetical protein
MEDPVQDQEAEASPAEDKPKKSLGRNLAQLAGKLLPKFGLFLFMVAIPFVIAAYPAYVVVSHLAEYASAKTVDVKLESFEIKTIDDSAKELGPFNSRKHVEIAFSFKAENGDKYVSVVKKPWPAPGLKRKLSDEYAAGDELTLYLLPDKSVAMEEEAAKDIVLWLTTLAGLFFVFSTLIFLIWKRLAARMANILSKFPDATFRSITYGQLSTLLLAVLTMGAIFIRPVVVPAFGYLGAYLGLAALLSLSLRLLVFEEPPPPKVETEEEEEKPRARAPA